MWKKVVMAYFEVYPKMSWTGQGKPPETFVSITNLITDSNLRPPK
jgi:hypothetical protein